MSSHADPDVLHDSMRDVSDARRPTAEQARAIELLELNPDGRELVRLSLAQWRHVNRVVTALGSLGVPPCRTSPENQEQPR
ncbi:hypothetical protein [Blastococcus sp. CCUG 61487]|uniref:hypothetical protein n=1 Tax=Blastococcus sp. CCUG 61487 TaxID=1840703 RepID=UPI0010C07E1F|nr:hypothetical protein [Blastococcus sp. CCUG 61487]TKJ25250.1 hypothetical protein A6V29_04300 [Blastococcus sp. CCUG 61487]